MKTDTFDRFYAQTATPRCGEIIFWGFNLEVDVAFELTQSVGRLNCIPPVCLVVKYILRLVFMRLVLNIADLVRQIFKVLPVVV